MSKKTTRRHPAKMAAHLRKRLSHSQPTERDKHIQRLKREMAVNENTFAADGPGAGCLRTYCEEQAPQLQEAFDLPGEENRARIVAYLYGGVGELSHAFPNKPDLPSFTDWIGA